MSSASMEVGGSTPGLLNLSPSQITKFTGCEMRWLLTKTSEQRQYASSDAMDLGTLMHRLQGAWWSGRPWTAEWLAALIEVVGVDVGYRLDGDGNLEVTEGWIAPKVFRRALKIMQAWITVHGNSPAEDPLPEALDARDKWAPPLPGLANATLVALELPFDLPIPGVKDVRIRGFLDGLVSIPKDGIRVHDVTKILEFKTMGRWGKEERVAWDPQLPIYLWAARQLFGVESAVFEAISTYDYKSGPPERRFKRIELPYDQRAIDRTVEDMQRTARRAKQILKNPGLAVRNVGEGCTYCEHFKECLFPWET